MADPPLNGNYNAGQKKPPPKDTPLPLDPAQQEMPSDTSDSPPGGFSPGFGPPGRPDHPSPSPPPAPAPPAAPLSASTYTSFISITDTVISTAYPSSIYSSTYQPYNTGALSNGGSPTSSYGPNAPGNGLSATQTFGFDSTSGPAGFTSSFLRTSSGSGISSAQTGFTITPGQTTFQTLGGSALSTIGVGGSPTTSANGGIGGNASPTTFGFMSTTNAHSPTGTGSSLGSISAGNGFGTEQQGPTPIPEKQLAQQTKIGIGVGVGVWALISIALFTWWFLRRRNRPRPSPFQRFGDYDPNRDMMETGEGGAGIAGAAAPHTIATIPARPTSYLSDTNASVTTLPHQQSRAAPGLNSHPLPHHGNASDESLGLPGAVRLPDSETSSLLSSDDIPTSRAQTLLDLTHDNTTPPERAHTVPEPQNTIPSLPTFHTGSTASRTRSLTVGSDESEPVLPPSLGKLNTWLEENRRKSRMASLHDAESGGGEMKSGDRGSRPISVAELREVLARREMV